MANMQGANPAPSRSRRFARLENVWVYAASGVLVLFTAFVLLDTFAIARVEQSAMAADYSSIVAAQDGEAASSGGDAGGEGDTMADAVDDATESGGGSTSGADAGQSAGSGAGSGASAGTGAAAGSGASANSDAAAGSGSGSGAAAGTSSNSSGSSGARKGGPSGSRGGKPGASSHGSSSKASPSKGSSSAAAESSAVVAGAASASASGTEVGTYSDDNMQITVSKVRAYDTDIYVADVQVSSAAYLKTALAQNSFGRNLKDTTSNMAEEAGAVLAINGDYYGFRDYGYVLRNGVLYRDTAASGTDALVVYGDGSMGAASQDTTSAQRLKDAGAWQMFSFGPVLVEDGQIAVDGNDEVGQSMGSNPRTAIGMVSPLHYVVVVSDGRSDDNEGLSLYQLSQVLVDNGATFAYNLDGGGSTTMYFQGEVLNNPTSGNRDGERQVSDIVYFG